MRLFLLISFCCIFQQQVLSQSNSIIRSTTGVSGGSIQVLEGDKTFLIQQSVGQPSAIGTYKNSQYILRQGFIQPNVLAKIIDKNVPLDLKLSIYPNPFDKQISLVFNEEIRSKINITVFDVSGRLIVTKAYQPYQHLDVKLENLPSGSYLLKVVANQKQFITKILKK
ncbi:Por secretion system C-terminal sorting domain-containing protein [Flaviramulus basaltis]|uniref:Por secretion system C-terminal sorting domain-containing protein n=1 Tax=Flaviramulus basaltis TaxID=369401 RepID=A0A1K2ILS2_9FLAO|nr:T9SS type A sorting domain-containing protein [Flaviramulus basaltis]SFZ93254.1 Por secretion system C-terminal sorting domain-containing protein [Flaviramulus basaltis]